MILLLAGVVTGAAFLLLTKALWQKQKPKKGSALITFGAIALVAGLALLAATGRLHWLAAAFAAIFPFLRRVLAFVPWSLLWRAVPLGAQTFGGAGGQTPKRSEVSSGELRMTLDHASGDMDGEVLAGAFQGRTLSALALAELRALRAELTEQDSLRLLDAYLDRRHPGWADAEGAHDGAAGAHHDGAMTETRALEVLGLEPGAAEQDVIAAHRRLMQKLHPDRGGTSFLAAQLNEAKRVLLGR